MSLEFERREQRRARKPYRCDVCDKPILKGREYIHVTQKFDGEIHTFRQHIHCDALVDAYAGSDWSDGWEYSADEVREWLGDMCVDLYHEGKCPERDFLENCEQTGCFECARIRERALRPEVRRAAAQSVKDNGAE